jgi:hypothetical protein
VVNASTPQQEYIWLVSDEAVDLWGYAVVDRTFDSNGKVSNEFRHIFVFPPMKVAKGEWVRLYTSASSYKLSSGTVNGRTVNIHNFYWGSQTCVWNDKGGDKASLIRWNLVNDVTVPPVP